MDGVEEVRPESRDGGQNTLREAAFARMIDRGLEDAKFGRIIGHEEMKKRISSWIDSASR
jgi:predicted transcriptional regulator